MKKRGQEGTSFTLPEGGGPEMSDEVWERYEKSRKANAGRAGPAWDDPALEMAEKTIQAEKKLNPWKTYPEVGKDIIPDDPVNYGPRKPGDVVKGGYRFRGDIGRDVKIQGLIDDVLPHAAAGAAVAGVAYGERKTIAQKTRSLIQKVKSMLQPLRAKVASIEKASDLIYPAILAASVGTSLASRLITAAKDKRVANIVREAVQREQTLKRKALATTAGVGIAAAAGGAAAGTIASREEQKKEAIDPLTLGVGLAATVASTAIGLKEVGARKALMAALQKEQAQKKKLIAALVGIGGAGAGAGYIAAKKPVEKTEQTTVLQPIVMEQAKAAHVMLKNAVARGKSEGDRRKLHKMVRPFGKVYKTKKAKGWDVMVDAMLGDTSGTGAGH